MICVLIQRIQIGLYHLFEQYPVFKVLMLFR